MPVLKRGCTIITGLLCCSALWFYLNHEPSVPDVIVAFHVGGGHDETVAVVMRKESFAVVVEAGAVGNITDSPSRTLDVAEALNDGIDQIGGLLNGTEWKAQPLVLWTYCVRCFRLFRDFTFTRKGSSSNAHHLSHAAHAFYSSPFASAVIVTMDGSGDDGNFNIYVATSRRAPFRRLLQHTQGSLGLAYTHLSQLPLINNEHGFMAYAAKGRPGARLRRNLVKCFAPVDYSKQRQTCRTLRLKLQTAHLENYAATVQKILEETVAHRIQDVATRWLPSVDGLVLGGGVALNVRLNSALAGLFRVPVFVPPSPGDGGLALGLAFNTLRPAPPASPADILYVGLPIVDQAFINAAPGMEGLVRVRSVSIAVVAQKLVSGAVIAVMRGRKELGDLGLGHRSILTNPQNVTAVERIRRLVGYSEYDYVPLMMPLFFTPSVFGVAVPSPHLSFAMRIETRVMDLLSNVMLNDTSIWFQTVTRSSEAWLHELLTEMRSVASIPILVNAPLRWGSRNLLNRAADALQFLQARPELDYVMIENDLFSFP
eukprot:NODE_809_length_1891_cov_64.332248_g745_i0.p1 GENE.NODE_809_length_1891_cov_64.332248_g745_i0~~NODE_809_length_1891_cov_64.332248_g745_i0.p1  ORF type:complete len:542 (+),score=82.24 NODE_809_length_1891_cov_64.332248_g745_i0:111-1736(+)